MGKPAASKKSHVTDQELVFFNNRELSRDPYKFLENLTKTMSPAIPDANVMNCFLNLLKLAPNLNENTMYFYRWWACRAVEYAGYQVWVEANRAHIASGIKKPDVKADQDKELFLKKFA